jgi:hypothetical protein
MAYFAPTAETTVIFVSARTNKRNHHRRAGEIINPLLLQARVTLVKKVATGLL